MAFRRVCGGLLKHTCSTCPLLRQTHAPSTINRSILAGVEVALEGDVDSSGYVLCLDDDVALHPGTVARLVDELESDGSAFMATGARLVRALGSPERPYPSLPCLLSCISSLYTPRIPSKHSN